MNATDDQPLSTNVKLTYLRRWGQAPGAVAVVLLQKSSWCQIIAIEGMETTKMSYRLSFYLTFVGRLKHRRKDVKFSSKRNDHQAHTNQHTSLDFRNADADHKPRQPEKGITIPSLLIQPKLKKTKKQRRCIDPVVPSVAVVPHRHSVQQERPVLHGQRRTRLVVAVGAGGVGGDRTK